MNVMKNLNGNEEGVTHVDEGVTTMMERRSLL
jgi:hypothetical protein